MITGRRSSNNRRAEKQSFKINDQRSVVLRSSRYRKRMYDRRDDFAHTFIWMGLY